jgi:hypothetical protein
MTCRRGCGSILTWRSPSTSLPSPLRPGRPHRTRSGRDVLGQTGDLGLAFLGVAAI